MDPVQGRLLATAITSTLRRLTSVPPGARLVEAPVRMGGRVARRRVRREVGAGDVERLTRTLTRRLTDVERDFARLEPADGELIVAAVVATLGDAVTMDDVQAAGLDSTVLRSRLAARAQGSAQSGTPLYHALLGECCTHIVDFFTKQPEFLARTVLEQAVGQAELLRRVPVEEDVDDTFDRRYRAGLRVKLDQARLFGVTELDPQDSTYELTTAYVSLVVQTRREPRRRWDDDGAQADTARSLLEDALARSDRMVIEGPAGSGKSTLLRRLAVHVASGDLPARLASWTGRVPFLLKLRAMVTDDRLVLPAPADFVAASGSTLGGEQPTGWAARRMRDGRAVVFVDGVDELPEGHRADALDWLEQLCVDYPDAAYVLTSRPRVLSERRHRRLRRAGFVAGELQAMSSAQVALFVDRWHRAQLGDPDELAECAERLKHTLDGRRDLARFGTNPLLCALMCALHRYADQALPEGRTELYRSAMAMLLGGRERARRISTSRVRLQPTQTEKVLAALAMWMTLNGRRSITQRVATACVADVLTRFRQTVEPPYTAEEVLESLVARSGLLQEPELGVFEFGHASFQDYLAALEIVRAEHLDHLINHAHDPLYHDVLIMAVGRTQDDPSRQRELLDGLIARAGADPVHRDRLWLLGAACVSTAAMVDPERADRFRVETSRLLPPRDWEGAENLAGVGEFVLDLLADLVRGRRVTDEEAHHIVRTVTMIAGDATIPLLSCFRDREPPGIRLALLGAWSGLTDRQGYYESVLKHVDFGNCGVRVPDLRGLEAMAGRTDVRTILLPAETTEIPFRALAALPRLDFLGINGTRVTDLRALAELPGVHRLWLGVEQLSQPSAWDLCPWLTHLDFTDEQLEDLRSVPGVPRLRSLGLGGTRITDLSALVKYPELDCLDIMDAPVTELGPLSGLPVLRQVFADGSGVSDLTPLAGLPHLSYVGVSGARVTDLTPLIDLPALSWLRIDESQRRHLGTLAGHVDSGRIKLVVGRSAG
ncbi:NACHT domain-containing protein [Embleya sp. NBC_00888]|uniref:NACHT domain-containing protein n=1 Tax=Embleya sp. NBC_00888 TaxID=2975960 RepID=UPI003868420A|nr:NACHT domain-containing protein [Embleya sp. NBC_00888]